MLMKAAQNTGEIRVIPLDSPERQGFLSRHFGQAALKVEGRIFDYAGMSLPDYSGGLWDFAETPRGGGFMVPPKGNHRTIEGGHEWTSSEVCCADCDGLSREAAGLCLTILAVNHLWNSRPDAPYAERLGEEWEALMDCAYTHPEASKILRVLD